jgi:integrase
LELLPRSAVGGVHQQHRARRHLHRDERVVWHVVKGCAKKAPIENLAPHGLRRTRARLCRDAKGDLAQIQFLLGHDDRIGIEPNS